MRILSDPYYLIKCYEDIKSRPGNMTKGIDSTTLDKIATGWFENTAKRLRNNSFNFTISRRTEIPKPNSNKKRPLTIGSPRDKIVQQSALVILQAI